MQECLEHSAKLLTFIKLPFVIKIFLSIFEWPNKTGFTSTQSKKFVFLNLNYIKRILLDNCYQTEAYKTVFLMAFSTKLNNLLSICPETRDIIHIIVVVSLYYRLTKLINQSPYQ